MNGFIRAEDRQWIPSGGRSDYSNLEASIGYGLLFLRPLTSDLAGVDTTINPAGSAADWTIL